MPGQLGQERTVGRVIRRNIMSRLNTEFNYRYQVIGETTWEKIKTLKGFLNGRKRAAVLEEVQAMKREAKIAEIEHLKSIGALKHIILEKEAEFMEYESSTQEAYECYRENEREIAVLEKLLAELYEIAEPTRIEGYDDDMMFEVNAANEFTMMIAREIQAEIMANGRPSSAKLHNAMSNPYTFNALKEAGFIPAEAFRICGNVDPLQISVVERAEENPKLLGGVSVS